MASRSVWDLHPSLRDFAEQHAKLCQAEGFDLLITCTYRSAAEQDTAYAQGRTAPGAIITQLRGGQSLHNHVDAEGKPCALAYDAAPLVGGKIDLNPATCPLWTRMGALGEQIGLAWGGSWPHFKDYPHFELPAQPAEGKAT